MGYDKSKILQQAKDVIVKHKLYFIEDIVSYLPISKKTYYEYFPVDSDESNELKDLLEINRTETKVSLRKRWYDSDNATLQMGLMKLICNKEERMNLSQSYQDVTTDGDKINQVKIFQLPDNERD